jgi:queuine/archaeosine tRNA-ribosyltransferase
MYAVVMFGERRRHCHACKRYIERTSPHLRVSNYGLRMNLCQECVIAFAEELKYKLRKEVKRNAKKKAS